MGMNDLITWKLKRIAKKIKQKDVAAYLGISASYVSLYEDGKVHWDQQLVTKYRKFIEGAEEK